MPDEWTLLRKGFLIARGQPGGPVMRGVRQQFWRRAWSRCSAALVDWERGCGHAFQGLLARSVLSGDFVRVTFGGKEALLELLEVVVEEGHGQNACE